MPPRKDPDVALMRLAHERAGVLTRSELARFDRHGKAQRRWIRGWATLAPGYYCVREPTWLSWLWAGLLRAGPGGVVAATAAAHLHGIVADAPARITIRHDRDLALAPIRGGCVEVVFRRGGRVGRSTPARTSVETTLLDLAGESDESQTVAVASRALALRRTTAARLLAELDRVGRVRHQRVLRELCTVSSAGVESVLEWRFLQRVVRAHCLLEPTRQASLVAGTRSDNVWLDLGVVAEVDGRLGHEQAFRDMARDNRLALMGLVTLRYGWHDVTGRPCAVAAEIGAVLRARGWPGKLHSCRDC